MYAGRKPTRGDRLRTRRRCQGPADPASPPSPDGTEAAPLELTLQPDVRTDVDDASGRWQHERGRVSRDGTYVGIYASTSHLVPGSGPPDHANLTLTIFFLGTTPPQTLTVHGAHDAGSNSESGVVSAASAGHAGRVGNTFRRAGDTVTID